MRSCGQRYTRWGVVAVVTALTLGALAPAWCAPDYQELAAKIDEGRLTARLAAARAVSIGGSPNTTA